MAQHRIASERARIIGEVGRLMDLLAIDRAQRRGASLDADTHLLNQLETYRDTLGQIAEEVTPAAPTAQGPSHCPLCGALAGAGVGGTHILGCGGDSVSSARHLQGRSAQQEGDDDGLGGGGARQFCAGDGARRPAVP
ncbi:MAG TPA: hypothetical protein VF916_14085 [Ktedonobacterales bacterium]